MDRKGIFLIVTFMLFIGVSFMVQESAEFDRNWHQWRGPKATGEAMYGNPPLEWSESKNIKWKVEIPGRGHATPIIWKDKVFIQTAVETDEKVEPSKPEGEKSEGWSPPSNEAASVLDFRVIALNRDNGHVLWTRSVARERPVDATHETGTWASNSPVTDGEHLYAYFGSRGLYCLDYYGNLIWSRDFGQMEKKMSFGEGSSPALYKDKLVIIWDHEGDSYLYILDKKTGKDIMKIPRGEATTWSSPLASPLVVNVKGTNQVITSGTQKIRSYNLDNGEILWEGTGMTANVIPHPVVLGSMLYLMSGFRGNAIMAIDLNKASGNINGTDAIAWEYNQNAPYTPSPLLMNGRLYFLRTNNGNLSCLDAADGKVNYSLERLDGTGTIFSSPVGVADRLYITSESGITYVIKEGPAFEILAKNQLNDGNFSSPAIVGNDMFIRGFQFLYCISEN
jgi:outer membrane protein assembly factor BamB